MARKTAEWVGRTDDAMPPPYVRLRIFRAHDGICHVAKRKIRQGEPWDLDHVVALCNGGSNIESNLAPILAGKVHNSKTRADVALRAVNDRVMKKSFGIKPKSRNPMPGSKASGLRKRMSGKVERR